ncbi:type VII secretion protein EccB [Streptomyces sp. DSM 40750]|uniref:type VII secretion protein EccB n=1 Tax=Streptomyces sp. DSM 40750 TaxID=2801030 RepID=UPI00214CC72D|nr:type VII secretion protein EccB [Streptomyces sp. DSM 40750]UUU23658.1 type VII secretion protein EccB [Streptomyces sp. DSM 40750]
MQSRRDQVQAYSFTVGRLTSGMLAADPDALDTPMSRTRRGAVVGFFIGLLLCVGFTVFGLIFPRDSDNWREPGVLIMEKETGARYLYGDGVLRPVLNYTSAKLVTGKSGKVEQVSRATLADVPRGAPIGIPGAPDSLPSADQLTTAAWQVCATTRVADDGTREATTTVGVGTGTAAGSSPLGVDEGLLVTAGDGKRRTDHLLWRGRRLRLDAEHGALQSLGYGTTEPLAVGAAFLSAVPAGPDLAAPEVAGRGGKGPTLAGERRRVGQYFVVRTPGSAEQYYLLDRAGLVPLSLTELQLLRGDPRTRKDAYAGQEPTAVELQPDEAGRHLAAADGEAGTSTRSATTATSTTTATATTASGALPSGPPKAFTPRTGTVPCLAVTPDGATPRGTFVEVPAAYATGGAVVAREGVAPGCPAPELIGVRPGRGVLVMPASTSGSVGAGTSGARYLVTGDGIKYPLSAPAVAGQLSYADTHLVRLPPALLRLLPTGPVLDPERAAQAALSGPAPAVPDPECGGAETQEKKDTKEPKETKETKEGRKTR